MSPRECRDLMEALEEVIAELGEIKPLHDLQTRLLENSCDAKGLCLRLPREARSS